MNFSEERHYKLFWQGNFVIQIGFVQSVNQTLLHFAQFMWSLQYEVIKSGIFLLNSKKLKHLVFCTPF